MDGESSTAGLPSSGSGGLAHSSSGLLDWDEDRVADFFKSLMMGKYEVAVHEHGITGDVLVRLDHELLKDIGVKSMGKRLKVLKAVYQMKLQEELPMEDGDWTPPSGYENGEVSAHTLHSFASHSSLHSVHPPSSAGSPPSTAHSAQSFAARSNLSIDASLSVVSLLEERDIRISSLEGELRSMQEDLCNMTRLIYGGGVSTPATAGHFNTTATNGLPSPSSTFSHSGASVINGLVRRGSVSRSVGSVRSPTTPVHPLSNDATAYYSHGRSGSSQWRSADSPRTTASGNSSPHLPSPALLGTLSLHHDTGSSTPSTATPAFSFNAANGSRELRSQPSGASLRSVASSAATITQQPHINGDHEPSRSITPTPGSSGTAPSLPHPAPIPSLSQVLTPALPAGMSLSLPSGSLPAQVSLFTPDSERGDPILPSLPAPSVAPDASSSAGDSPSRPTTATTETGEEVSKLAPPPSRAVAKARHRDRAGGSKGSGEGSSPFPKSFRVTIEDPCWKVLPAVLKKYKLDDDPKKYVLFLCYGPEERCLGYEEKPLMLFQKLKAAEKNPVFTLRHIKDLPNPVSAASAKHRQRLARQQNSSNGATQRLTADGAHNDNLVEKRLTPYSQRSNSVEGQVAEEVKKEGHVEKKREKDPTGAIIQPQKEKLDARGQQSPKEADGYAVAIYPYMADGPDEFDVAVGDAFAIIGKTKGWWVCYRDHGPNPPHDQPLLGLKSGWVPSGCLLETSTSFAGSGEGKAASATETAIPPESIVSQSTASVVLMDYDAQTADEVTMKKGETVRVYKKYTHWSFVVNPSNFTRGWAPSWLLQKPSDASTPHGQAKKMTSRDRLRDVSGGQGLPKTPTTPAPERELPRTPTLNGTSTTATAGMAGTGEDAVRRSSGEGRREGTGSSPATPTRATAEATGAGSPNGGGARIVGDVEGYEVVER